MLLWSLLMPCDDTLVEHPLIHGIAAVTRISKRARRFVNNGDLKFIDQSNERSSGH